MRARALALPAALFAAALISLACTSDSDSTPSPASPSARPSVTVTAIEGGNPSSTSTPGSATPTATATATGTVTSTATPEATPTPRPIDPTMADESYRDGDYELAAKEFARLAETTTGTERAKALLGAARSSVAAGDVEGARDALAELAASGPDAETALAALFIDAKLRLANEEYDAAAIQFVEYADAGGPAAIYARQDAATAYALAGDEGPAQQQLQLAIEAAPNSPQLPILLLALGQSFERTEDWGRAAETYQRLRREASSTNDEALALLHIGQVARETGDRSAWEASLTEAITNYPEAPAASVALDELTDEGSPPSPVLAGTVYYKSFRDEEAIDVLSAYLDEGDHDPQDAQQAAYYRATALERLGRTRESIRWYRQSNEFAPNGAFAERATWWGAWNLDTIGDFTAAAAGYRDLVKRFPDSAFAPEAGHKLALNRYLAGDYAESARQFGAEARKQSGEMRARALLWLGKAFAALGDAEQAAVAWQTAVDESDGNYFALRAELLLEGAGNEPVMPEAHWALPEEAAGTDWSAVESWVSEFAGPRRGGDVDPTASDEWRAATAVRGLGEDRRASSEMLLLLNEYQTEPWSLLDLVKGFDELELTHLAAIGAARLYLQAPLDLQASIPQELYRLSFPVAYLPIVSEVSAGEGVDPLLLYALVRQESFFDPSAVSIADARGLTQVIPSTGEEIARALGVVDYHPDLLLRPRVSLTFGGYYIGNQVQSFDGNLYFGLTAYNAGFGNASRWSDDGSVEDMDLYFERIDIDEPKLYIRYVLQNYARYRWIYGGAAHPTLLGVEPEAVAP